MSQSTVYPGKGAKLYLASSNPQEPVWPATMTIPSGSKSIGFPLNGGLMTSLNILFGTAPSGTAINIYYDIDPTFANEYILQAIVSVASQKLYTFSTSLLELDGFIRYGNAGGQDAIEGYLQQRATTA